MNKAEAIRLVETLRDKYDHIILTVKTVYEYSTAFGFKLTTHRYPDEILFDPRHAYGLSSDCLAEQLCQRFRIPYQIYHGRGSQLRECCERLISYFSAQPGNIIETSTRKLWLARRKKKEQLENKNKRKRSDDDEYEPPSKRKKLNKPVSS